MGEHEHTWIYCPYWKAKIPIDRNVAELLKAIWALEIETVSSCEDRDGLVELWFRDIQELKRFLLAARDDCDSIACYILRGWEIIPDPRDCGTPCNDKEMTESIETLRWNPTGITCARFPLPQYQLVLRNIRRRLGDAL